MQTKRIEYIDFIKFIAIYFVPFLHLITYGLVNDPYTWAVHDFMYTFHMPLFAMVSGYFFSVKETYFPFLYKKIKVLLIPILVWSLISVFFRVPHDIQINEIHLQTYIKSFWGNILGAGWFLKALFCCFVYSYSCVKFIKKINSLIVLLISVIFLCGISLCGIIPNKSCLEGFIFLYPFFIVGVFWRKSELFKKIVNKVLPYFIIIFFILYFTYWQHSFCFYTANTAFFNDNPIGYSEINLILVLLCRFFMGCVGSFACLKIVEKLYPIFHEKKYISKFLDVSCIIGQSSLTIYLSQDVILPHFRGLMEDTNPYVSFVFSIFITFIYCYLFSLIKKKFPSKYY